MGKLILIAGPNSSGKSAAAEALAVRAGAPRYYIATMVPETEENRLRIEKHRRQRAGKAFATLELPWEVDRASLPPESVVLLEDVSNLLANGMFGKGAAPREALKQILGLAGQCRVLVAVTIDGLSEHGYTGETADYIRGLNWLNGELLAAAWAAAWMENGSAVWRKGTADALD